MRSGTMKLKAGMWVVVADGQRGIVLVNDNTALEPQLRVIRTYGQVNPRTSEQGRDKPGRAFESTGTRRSATEEPDLHQRAEDKFVSAIMADLNKDAVNAAFDEVVIVAPPVALGEMRKAVAHDLKNRIALWVDKDLTNEPIPDITKTVVKALEG